MHICIWMQHKVHDIFRPERWDCSKLSSRCYQAYLVLIISIFYAVKFKEPQPILWLLFAVLEFSFCCCILSSCTFLLWILVFTKCNMTFTSLFPQSKHMLLRYTENHTITLRCEVNKQLYACLYALIGHNVKTTDRYCCGNLKIPLNSENTSVGRWQIYYCMQYEE